MTKRQTIALTGATGFVGRHLLRQLLQQGHQVRVLTRKGSEKKLPDKQVQIVEGDLFDHEALDQLTSGVDAVIHLVGIIMEDASRGQTFERVHVEGTKNLLAAARKARVLRWIHMSALGTRPHAHARYHQTKWDAEELVRHSGMTHTIFRPSIIHGPDGEFMQMVRDFCCKLMPPFLPYFGKGFAGLGGAGHLQPIWIEDVARCFATSLSSARTHNEIYPLGGPEVYTWPRLYTRAQKIIPCSRKWKRPLAIPAWKAKLLAQMLPKMPFSVDQVIMSQEESTCETSKMIEHFEFEPADFEEKLTEYADQIG